MSRRPPVSYPTFAQPPRAHGSSLAEDARAMCRLSARIFAALLPRSTTRLATLPGARRPQCPQLSVGDTGRRQSGGAFTPFDLIHNRPMPAPWVGQETLPMKVYRTESSYYFSSKQLLPAGAL